MAFVFESHAKLYYVCDVTLSVYPHRESLKNIQAYFSSFPGVDTHSE
jgi:hypothetical protein